MAEGLIFKTNRRELVLGERALIMGILNVTPDSFSDGGRLASVAAAVAEGERLVADGADILDIGGESTRPGSEPVTQEEEWARVMPVIRALANKIDVPISIDTTKAAVARAALASGAEIINDVSAMRFDAEMPQVAMETGAGVVLMHMRGLPKDMQTGSLYYPDLMADITAFLRERMAAARAAGVANESIMLDPGIGFGKTATDNMRIIKHLSTLQVLERPILTGMSRKAFIGKVTGGEPWERVEGTAAALAIAVMNGSNVVRVHDVAAMKKVAAMIDAIIRA